MARTLILVAAHALMGGVKRDKDAAAEPFTLNVGEILDGNARKKLGLSGQDVERLVESGAVVEQRAFAADPRLPDGQTAPGTTGTEFEGLTIDQMRSFLDDHKIKYPKDANGPDLMKIALEHQHPGNANASAAEIEKSMEVKDIKAELDRLRVPYETDANKPALAQKLAQARGAQA